MQKQLEVMKKIIKWCTDKKIKFGCKLNKEEKEMLQKLMVELNKAKVNLRNYKEKYGELGDWLNE